MIEVINIDKTYNHGEHDESSVLKDISFSVKENEFTLLKGPSGSGKSTILSIVGGLSKPTNGEVIIDKKSIAKLPDRFSALLRREKIGFIFQKFNLVHDLSAIDNITIPLIPSKISKHEIEQRAGKIMDGLSILHKKDVLVNYGCPLNRLNQEMSPVDTDFEIAINVIYEKLKNKIVRLLENSTLQDGVDISSLGEYIIAGVWGALSLSPKQSSKKRYLDSINHLINYLKSLKRVN